MEILHVALLGFGTVGKGVYQTIQTHQKRLQQLIGRRVEVSVIVIRNPHNYTDFQGSVSIETDMKAIIENSKIDVVFEAIVGIEPAYTYLKQCIQAGKHVITANKEMFAHHGGELMQLAQQNQVQIGFEATTAGGVPIIQTIKQLLQVNQIQGITAILNGTSNYILTEMRKEEISFTAALRAAQELGFAEADPTNDIEGMDAFYKLMILCELIFGKQPDWKSVTLTGIQGITVDEIKKAQLEGKRIRHIATVSIKNGNMHAHVKPCIISEGHPLFPVEGVENAIHLQTDLVGSLTLQGPGAGSLPTASAMIEELCMLPLKPKATKEQNRHEVTTI